MRLLYSAVAAIAFAFSTMSAAAEGGNSTRLWPQVNYEVLHFDKSREMTSHQDNVSWSRNDLLRKALGAIAGSDSEPLIEGWISSTAYGRLYWDREVYLVFAPKPATPQAEVCHVVVNGVPNTHTQPQGFAGGGGSGEKWCSEPGRSEVVPTPAQVRAKWPRGRVEDTANFRNVRGPSLTVMHVVGLKQYSWPLQPANVGDIVTIGRLPTTLENARRRDRSLQIVRIANGGWGLLLKYEPSWMNLSGCFVTAPNQTAVATEAWITPDIERWCQDHAARHFASIPIEQRPAAPILMGKPGKTWVDDW